MGEFISDITFILEATILGQLSIWFLSATKLLSLQVTDITILFIMEKSSSFKLSILALIKLYAKGFI